MDHYLGLILGIDRLLDSAWATGIACPLLSCCCAFQWGMTRISPALDGSLRAPGGPWRLKLLVPGAHSRPCEPDHCQTPVPDAGIIRPARWVGFSCWLQRPGRDHRHYHRYQHRRELGLLSGLGRGRHFLGGDLCPLSSVAATTPHSLTLVVAQSAVQPRAAARQPGDRASVGEATWQPQPTAPCSRF